MATYATGINCMDGAVQGAVRKDGKKRYRVQRVDMITQPGIVKILAENTHTPRLELIREMIQISVVDHGSRAITIAAHHSCAGNRVSKEAQIQQLELAEIVVKKMLSDLNLAHLGIKITLLWVNENYWPEEIGVQQCELSLQ